MSVPGEGAFTNSRADLSSLDAPLKGIRARTPKPTALPAVELPRIPCFWRYCGFQRRLGFKGQGIGHRLLIRV